MSIRKIKKIKKVKAGIEEEKKRTKRKE